MIKKEKQIDQERKINFLDEHFQETIFYFETAEEPSKEDCWRKYLALKRNSAFRNGLIDSWRTSFKDLSHVLDNLLTKDQFLSSLKYLLRYYKEGQRLPSKKPNIRCSCSFMDRFSSKNWIK